MNGDVTVGIVPCKHLFMYWDKPSLVRYNNSHIALKYAKISNVTISQEMFLNTNGYVFMHLYLYPCVLLQSHVLCP